MRHEVAAKPRQRVERDLAALRAMSPEELEQYAMTCNVREVIGLLLKAVLVE